MGINEILNLSSDRSKKYPDREKDQLLVHFKSLSYVNEQKFGTSEDPIVIFKSKGKLEQVKVLPFNYDNSTKSTLPFVEKMQYFSKKISVFRNNVVLYEDERNLDVTAVVSLDYGTVEELEFNLKNPTNLNMTLDNFFGSIFLDLKIDSIEEFRNGIGEIVNG